jgi:nicotinamide-nucleotide amidase
MAARPTAGILTVGTELTTGLRYDTNSADIARALLAVGVEVRETRSAPDDLHDVARSLSALIGLYDVVVVTGGLGPTHDDITREAAAEALGRRLVRDPSLVARLQDMAARHRSVEARADMLRQADIIEGATVLPAQTGSAPGQVVTTDSCTVVLLPGPPPEMSPLLATFLSSRHPAVPPVRLRCTGITESDAQRVVQPAIEGLPVDLTLLAAPAEVEVVLFAREGAEEALPQARDAALAALGSRCYSADGSSLAEVVVRLAARSGDHIATAESCTGGMVAAALTDVAGSSAVFLGGVVAYANDIKMAALNVAPGLLAEYGAVSEEVARAMAEGALALTGAALTVAVTGIAGPEGGLPGKPVGLVWFATARRGGATRAEKRQLPGDRATVRRRATVAALDLLRCELGGA